MKSRAVCMATAYLLLLHTAGAMAQTQSENTGANSAIERTVTGHVTFRNMVNGQIRGGEDFRLIVHPDGTRQITIAKDFRAVNAQQTIVARVDKNFRPLETYAAYWTAGGYKGAIFVTVRNRELRANAVGPKGHTEDLLEVPQNISVVHHGEIVNGWYLWADDANAKGEQNVSSYILNAAPGDDAQVSGLMRVSTFRRMGPERVATPAGTFDAVHYVMSGLDMWIAGEDRLLVRQVDERNSREYLLTTISTERKAAPAH